MEHLKVLLSPAQIKSLKNAIDLGIDFTAKLTNKALNTINGSGVQDIYVGKIQFKKLEKAKMNGNGLVLKLSSNQVKKMGQLMNSKAPIQHVNSKIEKMILGGRIDPNAALASTASIAQNFGSPTSQVIRGVVSITGQTLGIVSKPLADALSNSVFYGRNPSLQRLRDAYIKILNLSNTYTEKKSWLTFYKEEIADNQFVALNKGHVRRLEREIRILVGKIKNIQDEIAFLKVDAEKSLKQYNKKGSGLQIEPKGSGLQIEGSGIIDEIAKHSREVLTDPHKTIRGRGRPRKERCEHCGK